MRLVLGKYTFALVGCLLLMGCNGRESNESPVVAPPHSDSNDSNCPIYESTSWQARLKESPEVDNMYELYISGEITLPHPGYNIEWLKGPLDRMNPPGLRIILQISESDAMTIQVITPVSVGQRFETPISTFRYISIYCGNKLINQFNDVKVDNE
jgi:hypothetical protein